VLKNRCECCGKKVGLMGFKCRCGKTFCGVHRYAKEHSCTFDFKTFDRQILAKQNPLVAGDKLDARI
jgi:predicted nucleic acid binding AN1-type Zn finger protein